MTFTHHRAAIRETAASARRAWLCALFALVMACGVAFSLGLAAPEQAYASSISSARSVYGLTAATGTDSGTDPDSDPDSDPTPDPSPTSDIASAVLFYQYGDMPEPAAYMDPVLTQLAIDERCASMILDVKLTYKDGTTKFASEAGVEVKWEFTSDKFKVYASLSKDDDGHCVLKALGTGNRTVRVRASIDGVTITNPLGAEITNFMVNITDNDPLVTPQGFTLKYEDWWTDLNYSGLPQYYNASDPPASVMINGTMQNVTFTPQTVWSDGSVRDMGKATYYCTWSYDYATTPEGDAYANKYTLGTIGSDGTVYAGDEYSGFMYLTCYVYSTEASYPSYSQTVRVGVYNNSKYVTAIEILDEDYSEVGTGLVLPLGENIRQFHALVTYKVYDKDLHRQVTETVLSGDEDCPDLTWAVYRGDTEETELYSIITDSGKFTAKTGFAQARVQVTAPKSSYFHEDKSYSVRVTRESDEVDYATTTVLTVHVKHISDCENYGYETAPDARTETITRDQLEALGNVYTDWFTYRKKNDSWGTIYGRGVSIPSLLNLLGIASSDTIFMQFTGNDGYSGTDGGRHSADYYLTTRYRFSNFYMHPISSSTSFLGISNVAPMLALSYYMDEGNDYIASNFSKMKTTSTLRILIGMTGIDSNNAQGMVRCINEATIIVNDEPNEEEHGGGGGGSGGGGSGGGTGGDDGGGSGSDAGVATTGEGGGSGAGGQGEEGENDPIGSVLREIVKENEDLDVEEAIINNPWTIAAAVCIPLVFLLGALCANVRFSRQLKDGNRMKGRS